MRLPTRNPRSAAVAAALVLCSLTTAGAQAATFTVNDNSDSTGDCPQLCTLRGALLAANAEPATADSIGFDLPGDPLIQPVTALPAITGDTKIDGAGKIFVDGRKVDGGTTDGLSVGARGHKIAIAGLHVQFFSGNGVNVQSGTVTFSGDDISSNGQAGIVLGSVGNVVGAPGLDQNSIDFNQGDGIEVLADENSIQANTISNNGQGVEGGNGILLQGSSNTIDGNKITSNGKQGLGIPGSGITVLGDSNTITSNSIVGNIGDGVRVLSGVGNQIPDDSFSDNGTLAIDLGGDGVTRNDAAPDADTGANGLQNFPVIESFTRPGISSKVQGTLSSRPDRTYRIDFYSSPKCDESGNGEGATHFSTVDGIQTDGAGEAKFDVTNLADPGHFEPAITAIATETSPGGEGASEFSECFVMQAPAATDPAALTSAMLGTPGLVTGASYDSTPPGILGGPPVATVQQAQTAGFPRSGPSYALLTTGRGDGTKGDTDAGGTVTPPNHGDSARDVTILKADVNVPQEANCLQFDVRFGTDEFPATFNDGFVAELDTSDWSASGSTISAPHNFAFDEQHHVLSVNGTGDATANEQQAAGTPYRVATRLLRASMPVQPGAHSVYFSIFDMDKTFVDSGVMIDNLAVRSVLPDECREGVVDAGPKVVSIDRNSPSPTNAGSVDWTVKFSTPVTGVDASDFALDSPGLAGAGVTGVAGNGDTYTLTAGTGAGTGTLTPRLTDAGGSIKDSANTPLANAGFAGQAYSIDRSAPAVVSIDRLDSQTTDAGSVRWSVRFSEPVFGVDAGDFSLVAAGGVSGAGITSVTGGGDTYTITAATGSGSGTLTLNLADNDTITDAIGNPLGGAGAGNGSFAGQAYTARKVVTGPKTIDQLPPPTQGTNTNVAPEGDGDVFYKLPKGAIARVSPAAAAGFVKLTEAKQLPLGTTFDTSKGTLQLRSSAGAGKPLQDGHFRGGLFITSQTKKNPLTTLSMTGGGLDKCASPLPKGGSRKVVAAATRRRTLRGRTSGRFSSRGRNSTATTRGTEWTMTDTCKGTLTTVKQGSVIVRDLTLGKNKVLKKGQKYLARPPKKKSRK